MNKSRRNALVEISKLISEALSRLETVRDEEQDAFDAMPESLQNSERGNASEAALSQIEEAIGSLECAEDSLSEACSA